MNTRINSFLLHLFLYPHPNYTKYAKSEILMFAGVWGCPVAQRAQVHRAHDQQGCAQQLSLEPAHAVRAPRAASGTRWGGRISMR